MSTKLDVWCAKSSHSPAVNVSLAVDLTVHPSSKRASFPYPDLLPPFQLLTGEDILSKVVLLPKPSITVAGAYSIGFATALLLVGRSRWLRLRWIPRLLVLVVSALSAIVWARRRAAVVKLLTHGMDVSSSPHGPCCVTTRVVSLYNSHAGTHADNPAHFIPQGVPRPPFKSECYSGEAVVLELSEPLAKSGNPTLITTEILTKVLDHANISIANVWRLLLCTRSVPDYGEDKDEWTNDFATLSIPAAEYLAVEATRLLMVGVDAPSMDKPTASPLCNNVHGTLWRADIAFIENLSFKHLQRQMRAKGTRVEVGAVHTAFNPMQEFEDSRGCSVAFFPATDSVTLGPE